MESFVYSYMIFLTPIGTDVLAVVWPGEHGMETEMKKSVLKMGQISGNNPAIWYIHPFQAIQQSGRISVLFFYFFLLHIINVHSFIVFFLLHIIILMSIT